MLFHHNQTTVLTMTAKIFNIRRTSIVVIHHEDLQDRLVASWPTSSSDTPSLTATSSPLAAATARLLPPFSLYYDAGGSFFSSTSTSTALSMCQHIARVLTRMEDSHDHSIDVVQDDDTDIEDDAAAANDEATDNDTDTDPTSSTPQHRTIDRTTTNPRSPTSSLDHPVFFRVVGEATNHNKNPSPWCLVGRSPCEFLPGKATDNVKPTVTPARRKEETVVEASTAAATAAVAGVVGTTVAVVASVVASFSFSLLSFGAAEEEDDEEETHEEGTTHTIDEHTTKMRRRRPSTPTTTESKHRRSKTSPEPDKDAVHINDEPPPPQQQQSINTRTAVGYRNELQTRETSWTATGKAADAFAGTRQRRSTRHPRRNVRYQDQYPRSYAHPRLGSMRIGIVTYGGGSNAPVVPCSRNYRHGAHNHQRHGAVVTVVARSHHHHGRDPPPPPQQQSINTSTAVGYRNELHT